MGTVLCPTVMMLLIRRMIIRRRRDGNRIGMTSAWGRAPPARRRRSLPRRHYRRIEDFIVFGRTDT